MSNPNDYEEQQSSFESDDIEMVDYDPSGSNFQSLFEAKKKWEESFTQWTSKNEDLDKLIRKSQLLAPDYFCVLEWIDYSRLEDVMYIDSKGLYEALWIDGSIEKWDKELQRFVRNDKIKVGLQYINKDNLSKVLFQVLKTNYFDNINSFTYHFEFNFFFFLFNF